MKLSPEEARVIGVLIEKAVTTPDQYPLSLNGLTTGCNQKTNREPVMNLSEGDVQDALDSLMAKNLVSEVRFGGRVPKYQHRFAGSEFSAFKFNAQQTGVLCMLFLRGPQTPGELRTRTGRLCTFTDVQQTEACLAQLEEAPGGPFVQKLEREPGRRECRYIHLFGDPEEAAALAEAAANQSAETATPDQSSTADLLERVALLEMTVEELEQRLSALENR